MQNLSQVQFEKFSKLIYGTVGIYFSPVKKDMLQVKVSRLLERYEIDSYGEFYDILVSGREPGLFNEFINEITINKTDFFREISHFEFIKNNLKYIMDKNPRIKKKGEIKVWSCACSTGEEPYTIGAVLKEYLEQDINIKILATDVSSKVLVKAVRGTYPEIIKNEVEGYFLHKYFKKSDDGYMVADSIKDLITFRQFNLMNRFPFRSTFDMIFCRNVMIYFDYQVQQEVLNKLYEVLTQGGVLFIGHSEGLVNKRHRFQYVQPTIYVK